MTDWTEGSIDNLCCADCGCDITLAQYRRKVPRCDECEVRAVAGGADWPE